MTYSAESDNCVRALEPLAGGHLLEFNGLAPDCSLAALSAQWPPLDDWQGTGFLGGRRRSLQFQYLALGGLSQTARAWFEGDRVELIDLADPALEWADILALGRPAARVDTHWKGTLIPDGEWIYPRRGLSLHLRSLAEKCFHLVAYAPATLEEYMAQSRLVFDLALRPLLEDE